MYKNIRDGFSILLGLGFVTLSLLFITGAVEYDREKHNPILPMVLGLVLFATGAWRISKRRGLKRTTSG